MSSISETKKSKPDSSGGWKKITTIEKIRTASDGTVTKSIRTITETKGPGSGNSTSSDSETETLSAGIKKTTIRDATRDVKTTTSTSKDKPHTFIQKTEDRKYHGGHDAPTSNTGKAWKGSRPSDDSGSDSDDEKQFADECLAAHNKYRAKHRVQPLKLSEPLNKCAKEWAHKIARDDQLAHRPNGNYGENVFCMWSSDPKHKIKGTEPVDKWYSEVKDHKFGQEPTTLNTGHFSQVVWKESQLLGVAKKRNKNGKIFVVANYDPSGNYVGKFKDNVLPPQ